MTVLESRTKLSCRNQNQDETKESHLEEAAFVVGHSSKAERSCLAFPFLVHFNVPPVRTIGSASVTPSPHGVSVALGHQFGRELQGMVRKTSLHRIQIAGAIQGCLCFPDFWKANGSIAGTGEELGKTHQGSTESSKKCGRYKVMSTGNGGSHL